MFDNFEFPHLKSSRSRDLLLFFSTLAELCLDLPVLSIDPNGMGPMGPMAPMAVLVAGYSPPSWKALSAPGASLLLTPKRLLRASPGSEGGGGVRDPVEPASPASPGEAILPTAP